jgi:hypothetical protein
VSRYDRWVREFCIAINLLDLHAASNSAPRAEIVAAWNYGRALAAERHNQRMLEWSDPYLPHGQHDA